MIGATKQARVRRATTSGHPELEPVIFFCENRTPFRHCMIDSLTMQQQQLHQAQAFHHVDSRLCLSHVMLVVRQWCSGKCAYSARFKVTCICYAGAWEVYSVVFSGLDGAECLVTLPRPHSRFAPPFFCSCRLEAVDSNAAEVSLAHQLQERSRTQTWIRQGPVTTHATRDSL